jgi:WD40 repeat protein
MFYMKKLPVAWFLLLILLASAGYSQDVYFGKNKVRYKDFDWKYIQTRHFDIYFYEQAYETAKFAANVMESSYVEIVDELGYRIKERVPVFIYNSHNDFQQTNITPSLLPEGVGGFTEAFKNRIVIPFTGSYEDFRHVLHHELTHAVVYDLLFGNSLSSLLSRQRLFNLPLWFAEGYAEYSSRHGWDYWADMFVRDATINGYLTPPQRLGGYLAYKQGQAMVKYIADKYGERKLGEILQRGKVHLTMTKALKASIGVTEEELWEEFSKEMKRRYWPEIAERKEADEIGKQLTKAREDGSYFNEKPAFDPEGDKIAIFTDRYDYTEIVLMSAKDGEIVKRLAKSARSGDLESLHSYVSGMSFSPDGRELVFVAKSKGKESLCFLKVDDGDVYKKIRLDFYNILSPAWSPDGKKIAFSALSGYKRDLYIYHIESGEFEQLTDDRYDDVDPSWLPNSSELVFSSDRPHPSSPVIDNLGHPYSHPGAVHPGDFKYGMYNLFRIETGALTVRPVDVGPGNNSSPAVSPDGKKVAFISNRNGIDNIYVGYLDSVEYYPVTDILTGVRQAAWSPDGDELAFSALYRGAYDIFVLKELVPKGTDGELEPTAYVKGEYDLIDPSKQRNVSGLHADSSDTDSAAAMDSTSTAQSPAKDTLVAATTEADSISDSASALTMADKQLTPGAEAPDSGVVTSQDTLSIDTLAAVSDTAAHKADSTTADSAAIDSSVITETGIYDDEFVYVSDKQEPTAFDSMFIDIPGEDSLYMKSALEEPAAFDSIPDRLPDGEYEVKDYEVKFTPDYVGGGFAYDTFFGLRGQSVFLFSDYLGNHQIYIATDIVSSIDQSFVQAFYFNSKHRTSLGAGLFHTKNYYLTPYDSLFSDRFYGVQGIASRPFSTFSRIELVGSQYFINRTYLDRNPASPDRKRNSKVTTGTLSYVFDNVLWGYTGPVNGRRWKVSLSSGVNLFDAGDVEFYSLEFDYRKYWHFAKTFSMAFRLSGGASEGNTPKQYFLGGTTNWIGNRTLDAKVYDVENLYFAEVVTPLRAARYYELSGNRYGLVNWEFRFPMVQYFAMRYPLPIVLSNVIGAVFVDAGSAWNNDHFKGGTTEGGRNRLLDIKTAFGVGMRLNLFGFALLRYDIAWPTDFYKVADKPLHFFSFGADF